MSFNLLGKIASAHVQGLTKQAAPLSAAEAGSGELASGLSWHSAPPATRPARRDSGMDLMQWSNRRSAGRGAEAAYSPEVMERYRDVYSPATSKLRTSRPNTLGSQMRGLRAAQSSVTTGQWPFPKNVWNGQ